MKKIFWLWCLAVILLPLLFFLNGCGEVTENPNSSTYSLTLLPSSAIVQIGEMVHFYALYPASDTTFEQVAATFSLSGSNGQISSSGVFTAEAAGIGTVVAVYRGISASSTVTVVSDEAALATITVSPSTESRRVGETLTFSAVGKTISGEAKEISPVWSLSGDNIGVLTVTGTIATIEVTAEGFAQLTCSAEGIRGYAYVTIEGYVVTLTAEVDTYVDSENPNVNYETSFVLSAGVIDPDPEKADDEKYYQTYIKYDLSSLTGALVDKASLLFYVTQSDGANLVIKRIATEKDFETVTWNTKPALGDVLNSGAFNVGDNQIDIKDTVQYWLDSGTNYGIAIVSNTGSKTGYAEIASKNAVVNPARRPRLVIEYSLP